MLNNLAANFVLVAHSLFVAFAVFGGFGMLFHPGWAWVHVPVVMWSSIINLAGWTCPLTPLEKRFRASANGSAYEGGFVQHYVGSLVYPGGMPRQFELVAGTSIVVWNGLVYGCIYWWVLRDAAAQPVV